MFIKLCNDTRTLAYIPSVGTNITHPGKCRLRRGVVSTHCALVISELTSDLREHVETAADVLKVGFQEQRSLTGESTFSGLAPDPLHWELQGGAHRLCYNKPFGDSDSPPHLRTMGVSPSAGQVPELLLLASS